MMSTSCTFLVVPGKNTTQTTEIDHLDGTLLICYCR